MELIQFFNIMVIKSRKWILIALITVSEINIFGDCHKKPFCQNSVYNFDITIRAFPDIDSVHIGDTIFFEINEPVFLTDLSSGTSIDFSNAQNLTTTVGLSKLISDNLYIVHANSNFKFYLISGYQVSRPDTNQFREYRFLELGQRYQLKFGLIPQDTGVYKMFVGNALNVFRESDNCSKANFGINFRNTNQHLYLNQVSFPGIILQPGGGIYLFKVKQ